MRLAATSLRRALSSSGRRAVSLTGVERGERVLAGLAHGRALGGGVALQHLPREWGADAPEHARDLVAMRVVTGEPRSLEQLRFHLGDDAAPAGGAESGVDRTLLF